MKILDEQEAQIAKLKLEEEMKLDAEDESREFTSFELNWKEDLKEWVEAKNFMINGFQDNYEDRLFFVGHSNDTIVGKPQLIHQTIQRIPLIRKVTKIIKKRDSEDYLTQYKFIDDRFDKRYDGKIVNSLNMDFWVYKIIHNGREYYVLSEKELNSEMYEITGMRIAMEDFSEMNRTLKVNTISNIFIAKECESFIKTIKPEEIIDFVKERELDEEKFHNLLFLHPDGNIYDYVDDFNLLRKAQLLSGKYEGYPLHLLKMGPVGTGKTTEAEVLDFKFNEEQGILEAANSTLKSLVPSFKEKPANLGYICKCNRLSLIDEMMKMVEASMGHDNSRISNYFGQMNMLLEHKERTVGSGNDNSTKVKTTAKICITTNNITNKYTIEAHLGIIDPTTLSRMLVWVQDNEEIEKIYNKEGVKSPPHTADVPNPIFTSIYNSVCVGGNSYPDFLTIYDSCQDFIVNFDYDKCKKIYDTITNLIRGKMKQVWRARGLHHTILILDGLTKHRCIFRDFDKTFIPKEEDYDNLERILIHMVQGWDTDLNPDRSLHP